MAVNKASSQNSAASQVTKKPLNDLMDAIKEASSKRSPKADFKNLLAEPTKTMSMVNKLEVKPEVKPKEKTDSPPPNQKNNVTPSKRADTYKDADTLNTDSSLTEFDDEECAAHKTSPQTDQTLAQQVAAHQYTNTVLATNPKDAIKLASMSESDIQNWISKGQVRIEIQETPNENPAAQLSTLATRPETTPQVAATVLNTTQDNKPSRSTDFNDLATDITPENYTSKSTDSPHSQPIPQTQIPQTMATPFVQPTLAQDQLSSTFKSQQTITDLKSTGTASSTIKATKPGTLTTLDKLNALNQIKDQLKQTLQKGETHLKIQLKPNEMGKVDIKLDISRDGLVTAAFKAENRETLETLTRHMLDFQNIFKDAGLQADSQGMNFSMNRNDNPESGNFKGQILSDDSFMEEVKTLASSGLLDPSTINILT